MASSFHPVTLPPFYFLLKAAMSSKVKASTALKKATPQVNLLYIPSKVKVSIASSENKNTILGLLFVCCAEQPAVKKPNKKHAQIR